MAALIIKILIIILINLYGIAAILAIRILAKKGTKRKPTPLINKNKEGERVNKRI